MKLNQYCPTGIGEDEEAYLILEAADWLVD